MNFLTHQDDQLISGLRELSIGGTDDDASVVADCLDDPEISTEDIHDLTGDQLQIVITCARLGRNAWLRHILAGDKE